MHVVGVLSIKLGCPAYKKLGFPAKKQEASKQASKWQSPKQANKRDKTNTCCLIFFLVFTGFRVILGASGEKTFGSAIGPALRPLRSELVERFGVLPSFDGVLIFVIHEAGAGDGARAER